MMDLGSWSSRSAHSSGATLACGVFGLAWQGRKMLPGCALYWGGVLATGPTFLSGYSVILINHGVDQPAGSPVSNTISRSIINSFNSIHKGSAWVSYSLFPVTMPSTQAPSTFLPFIFAILFTTVDARKIRFPPVAGFANQQTLFQDAVDVTTGPAFAGLTTYANLPYVHCLAPEGEEVEKFDIAILGAPFDTVL